ncbi:MAG: nucleotidyl transferase AbiEii/AbiGii toxin family protein [Myxococcaceae bacterium]
MNTQIIQQRLNQYKAQAPLDEENALKEITQEIALSGLSRAGFFKVAAFQGGTCLRICHGLRRFSEDLDFALDTPNPSFNWQPYLKSLQTELEAYGYQLEISDRSSLKSTVKVGFLKDSSIGNLLVFHYPLKGPRKSLKIKLEIDTNPPEGSSSVQSYAEFPLTVPIVAHDLPSLFAGKIHAILCRTWGKGRDWFDFNWYVAQKTLPNFKLLDAAFQQNGPWQDRNPQITPEWLLEKLEDKIKSTEWNKQKEDIVRFVRVSDLDLLSPWGKDFFMDRLAILKSTLDAPEQP